jgi:hypothetical protein
MPKPPAWARRFSRRSRGRGSTGSRSATRRSFCSRRRSAAAQRRPLDGAADRLHDPDRHPDRGRGPEPPRPQLPDFGSRRRGGPADRLSGRAARTPDGDILIAASDGIQYLALPEIEDLLTHERQPSAGSRARCSRASKPRRPGAGQRLLRGREGRARGRGDVGRPGACAIARKRTPAGGSAPPGTVAVRQCPSPEGRLAVPELGPMIQIRPTADSVLPHLDAALRASRPARARGIAGSSCAAGWPRRSALRSSGIPGSGKSQLLNLIAGERIIPRASSFPIPRFASGPSAAPSLTVDADGRETSFAFADLRGSRRQRRDWSCASRRRSRSCRRSR